VKTALAPAVWLFFAICLGNVVVAQQSDNIQPKVTVRSDLVMVPVFATTREGDVVFGLQADDFYLTDNGIPQPLSIEDDTDAEPLALAIVVESGGAGGRHLTDYQELDSILVALIGNVEHRVALIAFDSVPHLVQPFTEKTDDVSRQLATLSDGDQGAAILDALAFAVAQLRQQPANYRRAILLLSETIDQGSKTTLDNALHLISDTNTSIYSFAFSSTRSAVAHEASKLNSHIPGPAHGCFSHEGADPEYDGHYSKQVLDCISQLAPPVRLATMAFLLARDDLRTKTSESIAQLAGGEFHSFHNARDLKTGLIAVSNDVPNYYVLSFRPTSPTPGIHALSVVGKNPLLVMKARREYWIDDEPAIPSK
jgi:VWFA-related protein